MTLKFVIEFYTYKIIYLYIKHNIMLLYYYAFIIFARENSIYFVD